MRTRLALSALSAAALAVGGALAAPAAAVPHATYRIINAQSEQCVHGWTTEARQVDLVPCDYPRDIRWNIERLPGANGYLFNLEGTRDCITTPAVSGPGYLRVENCRAGGSKSEWSITHISADTVHISPVGDPTSCMNRFGPLVDLKPCDRDNHAQAWLLDPAAS